MEGYIALHRKLFEWEWYKDKNTKVLFIHLLLLCNWKDKKWQGIVVKRGSCVTSQKNLAKDVDLTVRQVRTSLNKLILTGELTVKTTNKYSVVTLKNYNQYQEIDRQSVTQMTGKRQTNDKQMTTTNKDNKDNKVNKYIPLTKRKAAKSKCPLGTDKHKGCIKFLDQLAGMKNFGEGKTWINYQKQLGVLHKLIRIGYTSDDIRKEALSLDSDNYWWDKWDIATIASQLEKKGRVITK